MANVVKCYRGDCIFNTGCWQCSAEEVVIGTDNSCCTYVEVDIYAEAEGFKRPAAISAECEPNSLFSKPGIPTYKITPVP